MRVMVAVILLASNLQAWTAVAVERKEFCRQQWPGDYRMQEFCLRQQITGGKEVIGFLDRHGITDDNMDDKFRSEDPATIIYAKCGKDWPEDYRMMAFCLKQQEDSALRMGVLKPSAR